MIKIILLTGFFGSGKTTLIQSILTAYKDKAISVIINEFGQVSTDQILVNKEVIEVKVLEIDVKIPSCMPTVLYYSTGINIIKKITNLYLKDEVKN